MLYTLHEMAYQALAPSRHAAQAARDFWAHPMNLIGHTEAGRLLYAASSFYADVTRRYVKPEWNLPTTKIGRQAVRVTPVPVWSSPWATLLHFRRDEEDMRRAGVSERQPAVLLVAPLSGHYATLLRGTVEAFLPDHEVYVTDWANARTVPVLEGPFDFHDYVDHVRDMLTAIGGRAHVVAVCQPGPPVMAATALMAEDRDPSRPASTTYMGSPIDARLSPTHTNLLAERKPFAWFEDNMIHPVPLPYAGFGRRVYPGFVQLYSFMALNEDRHRDAHHQYFEHLVSGDGDGAARHREFYDEYMSVLDLTEEFYLQTIDIVFQRYLLPQGQLEHRGRRVRPELITDVALMTVEGEKDDISGVGQTQAAHALQPRLKDDQRVLHVQPEVGHYGVFNGRRFRDEIYPKIRDFILAHDVPSKAARPVRVLRAA